MIKCIVKVTPPKGVPIYYASRHRRNGALWTCGKNQR